MGKGAVGGVACYNCGKTGHGWEQCPERWTQKTHDMNKKRKGKGGAKGGGGAAPAPDPPKLKKQKKGKHLKGDGN